MKDMSIKQIADYLKINKLKVYRYIKTNNIEANSMHNTKRLYSEEKCSQIIKYFKKTENNETFQSVSDDTILKRSDTLGDTVEELRKNDDEAYLKRSEAFQGVSCDTVLKRSDTFQSVSDDTILKQFETLNETLLKKIDTISNQLYEKKNQEKKSLEDELILQLSEKDKQINALQEQNKSLVDALNKAQENNKLLTDAIVAAQTLHAATIQTTALVDKSAETKIKWWKKVFKRDS
jgi:hypothetical protein